MPIPSRHRCYEIICSMQMMDHIVHHSLQVCRVATFLADRLGEEAIGLDRSLIRAAALLHDITKTRSFQTRENHAHTGARHLAALGYPEVAKIVGQHVVLDADSLSETPTEAEIVNYADKRVLHHKVVSLKERMDYILEKYGQGPEQARWVRLFWERTESLEERLFRLLPFAPHELGARMGDTDCSDQLEDYLRLRSDLERRAGLCGDV